MIAGLFADQIEAMVSRHHRVIFFLLVNLAQFLLCGGQFLCVAVFVSAVEFLIAVCM